MQAMATVADGGPRRRATPKPSVRVEVPASVEAAAGTTATAARGAPAGLLIVDDDPDILDGMRGFLRDSLGAVSVHVATSAAEGLAVLDRERVDVVISDYRMPGDDGVKFLAKVRSAYPHVRAMLWTAFPDRGLAERAFDEAGAACFVTKLAPPAMLLALVEDLMASRTPRVSASHVVVNPAWRV